MTLPFKLMFLLLFASMAVSFYFRRQIERIEAQHPRLRSRFTRTPRKIVPFLIGAGLSFGLYCLLVSWLLKTSSIETLPYRWQYSVVAFAPLVVGIPVSSYRRLKALRSAAP